MGGGRRREGTGCAFTTAESRLARGRAPGRRRRAWGRGADTRTAAMPAISPLEETCD
jgi:hypothetical protein